MLVFGPYRAVPKNDEFIVYNFTSLNESIPRLPGLFVDPGQFLGPINNTVDIQLQLEKSFDLWYYDYIMSDHVACSSLMCILTALYESKNVYICISDYQSGYDFNNVLNESFMKMIQMRYDIKYSIINNEEDYMYIPKDGCDFMSVNGIRNFDEDRKRFMLLSEEQRILSGRTL